MFKYFITYKYLFRAAGFKIRGDGRLFVETNKELNCITNLKELENTICKENKFTFCWINNFILLEG